MAANQKDLAAGVTFLAIAGIYAAVALRSLPAGTLAQMGPGFFPLMLCAGMGMLGAILVGRGLLRPGEALGGWPWRAIFSISAAVIFFAVFVRQIGLGPAVFASSLLSSFAYPGGRLVTAVISSVAIAVFCSVVFVRGLGVPVPVFGPWLGG